MEQWEEEEKKTCDDGNRPVTLEANTKYWHLGEGLQNMMTSEKEAMIKP